MSTKARLEKLEAKKQREKIDEAVNLFAKIDEEKLLKQKNLDVYPVGKIQKLGSEEEIVKEGSKSKQ